MSRRSYRVFGLFLIFVLSALLCGCSRKLGWGVVLWSFDGSGVSESGDDSASENSGKDMRVSAGTIVPVLIKSNINHVYVVEAPETHVKVEVPLWKINLFRSRKDAEKRAQAFGPYANLYARTLRDGLVLRDEPRNTAPQVYRLRMDQKIKLLEKTEGEVVMTGGQALSGDWYLAMGEDGTRGYVFSNQLRIFDEADDVPARPDTAAGADINVELEPLFVRSWRPAYFRTMVEESRVDLDRFGQHYGVFVDGVRRQIRIEYPGASRFFNYSNITQEADGSFRFDGLPLTIRFQGDDLMELTIESDYGAGTYTFEPFDKDVREIARLEEIRRRGVLERIIAGGERFISEDFGALTLTRTGRFTWIAYDKLIPEAIPEYSGDSGTIDPALFLGPALEGVWDGGLSLTFDGDKRVRVDFVYRTMPDGLELHLVRPIDKEWAVVNTLSEPPVELSFRRAAF